LTPDLEPLGGGPPVPISALVDALAPLHRVPAARPLTWAAMISTVDGRATVLDTTRGMGGAADLELLLELRAAADAVLVGPRTLGTEGYKRLVGRPERRARRRARGLAGDPLAVVIARSGEVPWEAPLFAAPEQPVAVYSEAGVAVPADVAAPVEVIRLAAATPPAVLGDLRARRGVRVLACEGGPTLLGALIRAGCLDELFLTLAPALSGADAAPRIVTAGSPATLELLSAHRHQSELFLRYRVA
jgi:riboflavin biosynthesis pyrimidine reductase